MNRRGFLGIFCAAVAFAVTKGTVGSLSGLQGPAPILEPVDPRVLKVTQYTNSSNIMAMLKELYTDDKDYLKDLVYKENPFMGLVNK